MSVCQGAKPGEPRGKVREERPYPVDSQ